MSLGQAAGLKRNGESEPLGSGSPFRIFQPLATGNYSKQ